MACVRGHTEVVRLLLTVPGVSVNWRDKAGYTALMAACRWQQSDAVIALLADPRTDANVKDLQNGFNAMMLATGDMRILQALLADGRCDPNAREKVTPSPPLPQQLTPDLPLHSVGSAPCAC